MGKFEPIWTICMTAWATEQVRGLESARNIRLKFVEGYINQKDYQAPGTLENAEKKGPEEISLIYSYGALVWEQLRMKIGDTALIVGMGELFQNGLDRVVNASQLFSSLEHYTSIDIDTYMKQWVQNNAKIDLKIGQISTLQVSEGFETTVQFQMDSDRDYEVFTVLCNKTSEGGDMKRLPVHITDRKVHSYTFVSDRRPNYIQIDSEFQVPQIKLDNDIWVY